MTIVTSTRGVTTIKFTSRALTAFAAFAATTARGAGVTFMITAAAFRVEAFAAFDADNFAFEFTSRLRRLRLVTAVTFSGRGSCLNESGVQRSVCCAGGVSESRLGFAFDRPTRVRLARENRVPSRAKDCKKLFSSPRPPARVESRAPLDPLAGLLASVGLLALAAGARGASSSSAANGFDDMTHERQRRGDASKMNLPLEPRCLGRRLTSTDARRAGVDAAVPDAGRSPFSSSGRDSSRVPYEGLATFPDRPPDAARPFSFR